jgi:putative N6-adenine-specific DNA methylase
MELFVTCPEGIEPLLMEELTEMGFTNLIKEYCGVSVEVENFSSIYKINYLSRIASRVLLPIARFKVYDAKSLYLDSKKVKWTQFIPEGKSFAIDANVHHPNIRHSLFAAQVVKDAICDQFRDIKGTRPTVQVKNPDVQLNLFIDGKLGILSFDTSGMTLNKRGYRQESVEAPIRETLAAAMLRLAKYKGDETLYDPCCGSGTFLIEAALIATKTPPGFLRSKWGFQLHPQYSEKEWLDIKNEADSHKRPLPKGKIFGSDLNKASCHAAKVNLRASGFYQSIEITQSDFRKETLPIKPTFLITNPPHGNRLGEVDSLRSLYRELGNFLKNNMEKGSKAFIFIGNLELAKEVGLAPAKRHVVDNGGTEARLLEFEIY